MTTLAKAGLVAKRPQGGRPGKEAPHPLESHLEEARSGIALLEKADVSRGLRALISLGEIAVARNITIKDLEHRLGVKFRTIKDYFKAKDTEADTIENWEKGLEFVKLTAYALNDDLFLEEVEQTKAKICNELDMRRTSDFISQTRHMLKFYLERLDQVACRRLANRFYLAKSGLDKGIYHLVLRQVLGAVDEELFKIREEHEREKLQGRSGFIRPHWRLVMLEDGYEHQIYDPYTLTTGLLRDCISEEACSIARRNEIMAAYLWLRGEAGFSLEDEIVINRILDRYVNRGGESESPGCLEAIAYNIKGSREAQRAYRTHAQEEEYHLSTLPRLAPEIEADAFVGPLKEECYKNPCRDKSCNRIHPEESIKRRKSKKTPLQVESLSIIEANVLGDESKRIAVIKNMLDNGKSVPLSLPQDAETAICAQSDEFLSHFLTEHKSAESVFKAAEIQNISALSIAISATRLGVKRLNRNGTDEWVPQGCRCDICRPKRNSKHVLPTRRNETRKKAIK